MMVNDDVVDDDDDYDDDDDLSEMTTSFLFPPPSAFVGSCPRSLVFSPAPEEEKDDDRGGNAFNCVFFFWVILDDIWNLDLAFSSVKKTAKLLNFFFQLGFVLATLLTAHLYMYHDDDDDVV